MNLPATQDNLAHDARPSPPQPTNNNLAQEIAALRNEVKLMSLALGRTLALLDPLFVIPEDHPRRKADSHRLSQMAIDKLRAEAKANGSLL